MSGYSESNIMDVQLYNYSDDSWSVGSLFVCLFYPSCSPSFFVPPSSPVSSPPSPSSFSLPPPPTAPPSCGGCCALPPNSPCRAAAKPPTSAVGERRQRCRWTKVTGMCDVIPYTRKWLHESRLWDCEFCQHTHTCVYAIFIHAIFKHTSELKVCTVLATIFFLTRTLEIHIFFTLHSFPDTQYMLYARNA